MMNDAMPPRKKMKSANQMGSDNETRGEHKRDENFGDEWRKNLKGVRDLNQYALTNKILTDITFEVGSVEQRTFHAHRLILAIASPVFEAMFYGPLAEKGEKVIIPDISPEGFDCLLKFIYTEKMNFKNEVEAFKTSTAADKYCVPVLKEECEKYIYKSQLSAQNVWIMFENALFMGMSTIVKKCLEFFKEDTKFAFEADSFLDTNTESLEKVLQLDSLDLPELSILKHVVRWGKHKCSSSNGEVTLKEVLDPLLGYIRFGLLSPSEFCSFLDDRNCLFTYEDALQILKHLVKPSSGPLPDWCCTKTWRSTNGNALFHELMIKKSSDLRLVSNYKLKFRRSSDDSTSTTSSSDDTDTYSSS